MFPKKKYFILVIFNFLCYTNRGTADKGNKDACMAKVEACESGNRRVHCGTDGNTYLSRCSILKAQCLGDTVAVAHKGPCAEGQSACQIALRYALSSKGNRAAFLPRCRADGSYAAMQCAAAGASAGCWCVTPAGKPLPDTAVRNGRPDCTRTGKSHTKRRSSARGQRNKKSCTRTDRIQFNSNLINIFGGEYERSRSGSTAEPRAVAEWKFRELDRDRSGALQKSEYRGLRRLIRKVVKPKRCARAWARGCDADGDGIIARSEWTSCLLAAPAPPAPDYEEGGAPPEQDYGEEEPPVDPNSGKYSVLPGSLMRGEVAPDGSDLDTRRDDDSNDCLTDRQAVLDEQKAGGAALYVPECTGDGRYARAQCYRSTGYCWCVHQDTGKPIPGSSVKDTRPDCDSTPQHASPMRGCPEPMKTNFLRELVNFFKLKMTASTNGTIPGSTEMLKWPASREEQAATWIFVMLDKDKNKALERREWKAFHQLISSVEAFRRCGRKLPRYCDVNHDARISITEWLACLDVAPAQPPTSKSMDTSVSKAPTNPKRKGPNPIERILKAD